MPDNLTTTNFVVKVLSDVIKGSIYSSPKQELKTAFNWMSAIETKSSLTDSICEDLKSAMKDRRLKEPPDDLSSRIHPRQDLLLPIIKKCIQLKRQSKAKSIVKSYVGI